jgi:hypothetical protein
VTLDSGPFRLAAKTTVALASEHGLFLNRWGKWHLSDHTSSEGVLGMTKVELTAELGANVDGVRAWMSARTVGRKETVAKINDFLKRKLVYLGSLKFTRASATLNSPSAYSRAATGIGVQLKNCRQLIAGTLSDCSPQLVSPDLLRRACTDEKSNTAPRTGIKTKVVFTSGTAGTLFLPF